MKLFIALACLAIACRDSPRGLPSVNAKATKLEAPITFDAKAIEDWVASEITERGTVGAALVVVRDGKTVIAKGFGTKRLGTVTPIDADTPFAIGSISKQMTCAAILALADDGKLALSDPVAKYYPDLTRAADITLDDLGAHTSGYPDYYPLDYIDSRMLAPIEPDALIARYAKVPLDFEPRTKSSYSNTGFVILGRVAERVSGTSLGQLLADKFWNRLGMTHTTEGRPPTTAAEGHAGFLLGDAEPEPDEQRRWLFGAGEIYASANDLARWDLAIADGKLLSQAGQAALVATHRLADGRTITYGCGLGTRQRGADLVYGHTGAVGGFLAYNTVVPRTRTAVILLQGDARDGLGDVHDKIVSLVLDVPSDIPKILGPEPDVVARELVRQLQHDELDRTKLGQDLGGYFERERIAKAAPRLRALGEPKIKLTRRSERGGWEVSQLELKFPERTVEATMFRSPDGKIRQFLLSP